MHAVEGPQLYLGAPNPTTKKQLRHPDHAEEMKSTDSAILHQHGNFYFAPQTHCSFYNIILCNHDLFLLPLYVITFTIPNMNTPCTTSYSDGVISRAVLLQELSDAQVK